MILGIGIDAVNIDRLKKWKPSMFERFFHPDELRTANDRGLSGVASLASRFAAKEAFGKALGTGLKGFTLKEVAVLNDEKGKPILHLTGRALDAFESAGGEYHHVSLTHEHDYAVAAVIIEGRHAAS